MDSIILVGLVEFAGCGCTVVTDCVVDGFVVVTVFVVVLLVGLVVTVEVVGVMVVEIPP